MDENKEITAAPETAEPKFRAGTLEYTKRGLFMLFVYLLWGDFCFTLMESVFPQITPLTMKNLGSNDFLIGLVMITIPNIFNAIVCPWVSFKSDRHRSKLGRRIPFLLYPTPAIALFLIMIGFSPDLGRFLGNTILHSTGWGTVAITLGLIAVFSAGFQYFNMFVGSVYYYLFNDVVPDEYLSRFMAAFRLVGLVAGALFNFVIFRYAESHMKWIFIGAGVLYFVAFMQMSLKVKEGEYPPPPEYVDGKQGVFSGLKTYFKECFSHKFYWYFFLSTAFWELTACIRPFDLLLQRQTLALTPGKIGMILGTAQIVTALFILPAGIFSDKHHPLRTTLWASVGLLILTPTRLVYLFHHFDPGTAFWVEFSLQMVLVPLNAIYTVSSLPMYMRILPAERYGQFCSAQAMFRSSANILFGTMAGGYMVLMKKLSAVHHMYPTYYYGFSPLWTWVLQIVAVIFLFQLYKSWKERGGDESFTPPPVGVSE
ncbi:MAG TPA: MFS transporter [Armatimonadota bacterium]